MLHNRPDTYRCFQAMTMLSSGCDIGVPVMTTQPVRTRDEHGNGVEVEAEIVRESLRVRCHQAFRSFYSLTAVLVVVGLLTWDEVPPVRLVGWLFGTFVALCWRIALCKAVMRRLDVAGRDELDTLARKLFWNTIPLNVAMGAGMWWAAAVSTTEIQFFVTLAICFYAIGALINLSSNAASFQLALALNLGQAIAFWAMEGVDGMKITVPLLVIAYLLVSLGRENQRAFARSVRMRFENIQLIAQLDREKQAVERALATAEEASRSKSAFLAAASHDLRQPLHALSFYAGSLSMHVQEQKARETVGKVRDTIRVLETLFGNLLDLARFDTGNVQPQLETLDIDEILQHLDSGYRPLAEAKGLELRILGVRAEVRTDAVLLERLLGNLLHNAIAYTETGRVQVSAVLEPSHVRVTVEDTGIGISVADRERIFDEFQQLHNPGRRRERGVGLGLSIVRRIDRLLDLKLELESEPGGGTRFTLRVPRAAAQLRRGADGAELFAPEGAPQPLGLRVWVLDDEQSVRDALATQLDAWGCVASVAEHESALAALKAAEDAWPDALIADDMLGTEKTGLDVARECAAHMPMDRIIVMTGATRPERLAEIRAAGFTLMCKPANPEELYVRLREIAAMT